METYVVRNPYLGLEKTLGQKIAGLFGGDKEYQYEFNKSVAFCLKSVSLKNTSKKIAEIFQSIHFVENMVKAYETLYQYNAPINIYSSNMQKNPAVKKLQEIIKFQILRNIQAATPSDIRRRLKTIPSVAMTDTEQLAMMGAEQKDFDLFAGLEYEEPLDWDYKESVVLNYKELLHLNCEEQLNLQYANLLKQNHAEEDVFSDCEDEDLFRVEDDASGEKK
ncbi:MAG: hypothetical protein LBT05_04355 [Planctomycetaceae bacterium]|nr:hypothetical protein [Planctomycetaceae bacterium]